jgi:hypothetical protein
MDRQAIRGFVARARGKVAALKRDHHARRFRSSRGASGLQAAALLRDYVKKVRPDWPSRRERADDLAHHLALKKLIDRASHAFRTR